MSAEEKDRRLKIFIDKICEALDTNDVGDSFTEEEQEDRLTDWADEGTDILTAGLGGDLEEADFNEVEEYFKKWEEDNNIKDNELEFKEIEAFILEEQHAGRERRRKARVLAASEEVRLAADVAELKGYRIRSAASNTEEVLRNKIADVEKAYVSRKMVVAKAAQLATSDCRKQFTRVREFFQTLQNSRQKKLRKQFERSLKLQAIFHRLRGLDTRVMALEQNTASRIYRKKESDLNEINMVQNLEEAVYLETVIDLLDKVQEAKEAAVNEHFKLQIQDLKNQQEANQRREDELNEFKANATLEMAKLVAKYVEDELMDNEDAERGTENVDATERRKTFDASSSTVLMSVSELYDTILWSVATGNLGLTSDGDSLYSSVFDGEDEGIDGKTEGTEDTTPVDYGDGKDKVQFSKGLYSETGSVQSNSTSNTGDSAEDHRLSPVGNIMVKQRTRELRMEEKKIIKRHAAERKQERRRFREQARELKRKHQQIVDGILAKCVDERHRLRDAITQRMKAVEQNQESSTQSMQEAIEEDVSAMQQAWAEHKRLEDEQKNSFAKAQALISAQVYHEVRNALSSVVAMSEMTSSLQSDPSISSETLVSSVNEMLGQNKEVVNYSLNMLNNILDVSKIKAGSFETKKKFFDLQDLVSRATKMQLVKAQTRKVNMSFKQCPEPQIAYTDEDIVVRIVTNFISNAVKFTTTGAIQPFICPLEAIDSTYSRNVSVIKEADKEKDSESRSMSGGDVDAESDLRMAKMRMVAVGVADTGPGLSRELLNLAKAGLFSSDSKTMNSGAKNSGFGLHLAHQLAGTLDTEVFLTDLKRFSDMCNNEMTTFLNNSKLDENGTVLYITVPVLEDGNLGKKKLKSLSKANSNEPTSGKYTFSPRPLNGTFRILVADDVPMLRKGLMRSVLDIFSDFPDCPVSVSTACSAEDALRAVESQPYDLFICDNQFAAPGHLKKLSAEMEKKGVRPQVTNKGEKNVRKSVIDFFADEQFTIETDDGNLAGIDALFQLVGKKDPRFPIPVLILHSGHELDLPEESGIIVVQKPLKRAQFVPMFESHAQNLVETGMCVEIADEINKESQISVVNKRGSQIFVRKVIN